MSRDSTAVAHAEGLDSDQMAHFAAFSHFVEFFCAQFKDPNLVAGVDCKQSFKDYIFTYFREFFTYPDGMTSRHLKWFRRLLPVLTLPVGSSILDYGGGYGMDTIFLASRGYRLSLLEISANHLAISQHLASKYAAVAGNLEIRPVLGSGTFDTKLDEPVDAVLLNEVAHHLEPPEDLFAHCARLLRPGGALFLLEPNPWNVVTQAFFLRVRGLKTIIELTDETTGRTFLYGNEHIRTRARWTALASAAGFQLADATYICPYFQQPKTYQPGFLRSAVESSPGVRSLMATHIVYSFVRRGAR
jgi:SAM-dependent methyltransferase